MIARLIGAGIIIAALLAHANIASAQSDVPDLKGRWTSTTEVVLRSKDSEHIDPTAIRHSRPSRSRLRLSARMATALQGRGQVRAPPIRSLAMFDQIGSGFIWSTTMVL